MDWEEMEKRRQRRRIDEEIKRQARELYKRGYEDPEQRLSINKVAARLGISQKTVWRIIVSNNESRRSISEALMRYPKTNFGGDLAEQARIIGYMEDCDARYNHKQIRVGTSTTHPPMIRLFNDNLGKYGHVGMYPRYNKRFSFYQWNLYVDLNDSFDFIPEYKSNPMKFVRIIARNGYEYVRIASLTDTEGSVFIDANYGHPRAVLSISNNNRQLLEFTQRTIGGGIGHSRDGYELRIYREEAVETLRKLPITHQEKVAAKELILRHYDNGGIGTEALWAYQELRRRIDDEVRSCTMQARLEWIRRHGKPHKEDPNQTIPTT